MTAVDATIGSAEDAPTAVALERVVEPVVSVTDGTITYANGTARDAFDLDGGGDDAGGEPTRIDGWETSRVLATDAVVAVELTDRRGTRPVDGRLAADVSRAPANGRSEAPSGVFRRRTDVIAFDFVR